MSTMISALVRALLALLALLGTPAHQVPMGPAAARVALLGMVHAHHGAVAGTGTYGYGPQGQHTALNGGVYVDLGAGSCVGYETYGHPGFFGNTYGFTGGDCS